MEPDRRSVGSSGSRPQHGNLLPEKNRRSITKKSDETKPIGLLFTTLAFKNKPKTNPNKANFEKQIDAGAGDSFRLPATRPARVLRKWKLSTVRGNM